MSHPYAQATVTEKNVQAGIKKLAEGLGFFVTDTSQGYRPGRTKRHRTTRITKGLPDLYLVHGPKRFRVWVECKRPGGEPNMDQLLWQNHVQAAGANVWTCDSVESFAAKLNEHGWGIEP